MRRFLSFCKSIIKKLISFLPASKNKIYFENFRGRGFGDDPRYIAEELHSRNPKYKMYWLIRDYMPQLPDYVTPVKFLSIKAAYVQSTSKVWISNVKNSYKDNKKKSQYYIQCWHSTLGLKRNEAEAPKLDEEYVIVAKHDASLTDLMYTDNDFRYEKYQKRFWYDGEVIKCGVPRISAIVNRQKEFCEQIRSQYNIPSQNKIALYLPTFRDGWGIQAYDIDHSKYVAALEKKYGCSFSLILKMHPSMKGKKFENMPKDAIDATSHEDPYELIAACDVLISDYSDCLFDQIIVKKPLFLIAKDLDIYQNSDRGFAIDLQDLPVSIATSEDQLCDIITDFDQQEYQKTCEKFLDSISFKEDFCGEKDIADIVEKHLK